LHLIAGQLVSRALDDHFALSLTLCLLTKKVQQLSAVFFAGGETKEKILPSLPLLRFLAARQEMCLLPRLQCSECNTRKDELHSSKCGWVAALALRSNRARLVLDYREIKRLVYPCHVLPINSLFDVSECTL
jgi:hypothetical protein